MTYLLHFEFYSLTTEYCFHGVLLTESRIHFSFFSLFFLLFLRILCIILNISYLLMLNSKNFYNLRILFSIIRIIYLINGSTHIIDDTLRFVCVGRNTQIFYPFQKRNIFSIIRTTTIQ